jgi:hypothetical protein
MSSEIFEVVASCSNTAEEFFASMYGTVCAPQTRTHECACAQAPGGNGKRARSMSGLMSGSTLYDTVLLLGIVAAIVVGAWLLWRI